jgi:hypothetical protein
MSIRGREIKLMRLERRLIDSQARMYPRICLSMGAYSIGNPEAA